MDVNNFGPFNSIVWGTVSDWSIFFVTAGSIVLLYRTLRSQTVVQEMQPRITRIENEKYRTNALPEFDVRLITTSYGDNASPSFDITFLISVKLLKNEAKKTSIILKSNHGALERSLTEVRNINIEDEENKLLKIKVNVEKDKYEMNGIELYLNLNFTDTVGNKYFQKFTLKNTYHTNKLSQNHQPRLINPL